MEIKTSAKLHDCFVRSYGLVAGGGHSESSLMRMVGTM